MYKVSVMYPNGEGARFDHEYYRTTHMDLVHKHLEPYGLVRTEAERGVSGGGDAPAPYICIGSLYFDSPDGYARGMAEVAPVLRGDISNFTNVTPIRQISEMLKHGK
jgi:uncharacterized protein (TIGR02118 family)